MNVYFLNWSFGRENIVFQQPNKGAYDFILTCWCAKNASAPLFWIEKHFYWCAMHLHTQYADINNHKMLSTTAFRQFVEHSFNDLQKPLNFGWNWKWHLLAKIGHWCLVVVFIFFGCSVGVGVVCGLLFSIWYWIRFTKVTVVNDILAI